MKLGFIGTGKITSSVVTGICRSKISFKKIILSPRNRNVAKRLKRQFKRVSIAKNNQENEKRNKLKQLLVEGLDHIP